MVGHPGGEPGVGAVEGLHPVLVAREDHHHITAAALHLLQQDLNRLGAVIPFVVRLVEVIRLIDEQHAPLGALEHLLGLGGGVPHVLAHQVIARGGDHMTFSQIAEAVEDLRHPLRHGGLAGTRASGEGHVQARRRAGQLQLLACLVHQQQGGDLADACFHRRQADQLPIQLFEHLSDSGVGVGRRQINRGDHRSGPRKPGRIHSTAGHRPHHQAAG